MRAQTAAPVPGAAGGGRPWALRAFRLGRHPHQEHLTGTTATPASPAWLAGGQARAELEAALRGSPSAPELTRSFAGALARLPDGRVAELTAMLEVFSFPKVLRALVTERRPDLPKLVAEWQGRAAHLRRLDGLVLRTRLVQAMQQRLYNGCEPRVPAPGLEAFLDTLVETLTREYGLPQPAARGRRLQHLLLALSRELPDRATQGLGVAAAQALRQAKASTAIFAALVTLAYLAGERMSLTSTTLLYVVLTSLFGVNLPFEVYRWIARGLAVLFDPTVVAASAIALASRTFVRRKRHFDLRMLAAALWQLYRAA